MKTIVITGSTRGIGFGLADSFLRRGCSVVICGRTKQAVDLAVKSLAQRYGEKRMIGISCDVRDAKQLQKVWDITMKQFKRVDIWINNAGVTAETMNFWKLSPEDVQQVISTNVIGTIQGTIVAARGMLQQKHGAIYTLEGLGSDRGMKVKGVALYGTSKAALRYFDDSIANELKDSPVIMGSILPGMVVTNLTTGEYDGRKGDLERTRFILNILGDTVETVTPWIADRVLKNTKNGARIRWLNTMKSMGRFVSAPITKRKIVN
jgi:NAD(P)-dependent dehydrogenase (short-subunit alcohol dehydrogenase family)